MSSSVYGKADRAVHFLSNKSRCSITLGGGPGGHPISEECSFLGCSFCHLCFLEFSNNIKIGNKTFHPLLLIPERDPKRPNTNYIISWEIFVCHHYSKTQLRREKKIIL